MPNAITNFFPDCANPETMNREEALNLLKTVADRINRAFLLTGGVLSTIHRNDWHKPEYANFQAFCDAVGLQYRKAMHLIKVYQTLVALGVTEADVSGLGYTKLIVLAPHLTAENKDFLFSNALTMTVAEIEDMFAKAVEDASKVITSGESAKTLEPSNAIIKGTKPKAAVSDPLAAFLITTPPSVIVAALSELYPDRVFQVLTN